MMDGMCIFCLIEKKIKTTVCPGADYGWRRFGGMRKYWGNLKCTLFGKLTKGKYGFKNAVSRLLIILTSKRFEGNKLLI